MGTALILKKKIALLTLAFALTSVQVVWAEADSDGLEIDITGSSIEELLNRKIISVSKKSEPVSHAAAAVTVLTADDIRRSGATSIPEALRYVPGVQVSRIDANKWSVTIRGFSDRTANKLLVLIDGRSVYDPLFAGVFWEARDVMLEEVDRIEVIRGPGATLWGSNAVNGVINIITKNAKETQGGLIAAGGGNTEQEFAAARYGAEVHENGFMRVYGKGYERTAGYLPGGADDDSDFGQGGFHYDSTPTEHDKLTLQGDIYRGKDGNPDNEVLDEGKTSGLNVLGRWQRELDGGGQTTLQFYYDRSKFDIPLLGERRHIGNANFQHRLGAIDIHDITWGLGGELTSDEIRGTPALITDPDERTDLSANGFLQDELALIDDELYLTLGSKLEHNNYTGFEVQPSARLGWRFHENDLFWTSVSRAVRVPSRLEADFVLQRPDGTLFLGNPSLYSEDVIAYESGVRVEPVTGLLFDAAAFYNDYEHLISSEGDTLGNRKEGQTVGFELATTYLPVRWWKSTLGYSYMHMHLVLDKESLANVQTGTTDIEGSSPNHQVFVRSGVDLFEYFELDGGLRYSDSLPGQDVSSYVVGDLRLAAHVTKDIELSVVGQNLFRDHHFEFRRGQVTEVRNGVYGKVVVHF